MIERDDLMNGRLLFRAAMTALAATALILSPAATAQTQPQLTPLFFTGVVGGDAPTGRRVLLRWDAVDGVVDLNNAVLFRINAANQRQKLTVVRATRNPQLIKAIFFRPGESRILNDAMETLNRIYGKSGATPDEFASLAIDLLEGRDQSEYASLRRNFLVQANYGFAIVEGRGYLDFVNPAEGPFVYEFWQGDGDGNPVDALGRLTLDANNPVSLPAPANLREVFLRGRDGVTPARANHRRIYLNFDVGQDLRAFNTTTFGYNIYKLPRALANGEDFDNVRNQLTRLNPMPILEPSPIEGEQADQSYVYVDDGEWLETGSEVNLLHVGDTATYWAVARDLLGNEGLPSAPLQATVRDTFEPDAPRGLGVFEDKDANRTPFLHVQWNVQTEDTVSFRVYRYQQYGNAGKKGPFPPVDGLTEGQIATVTPDPPAVGQRKFAYRDFGANQAPQSTGFWYCVSAVDASNNESALSPPMYGVIEDVVGPGPGRVDELCVSRPVLSASVVVASDPETRTTDWTPRFVLRRTHPAIVRVRIAKLEITPQRLEATENTLTELEFGEVDAIEYSESDPAVGSQDTIPLYRFTFEDATGGTAFADANPPAAWSVGSERIVYRATGSVIRFMLVCDPFGTGQLEPGPVTVYPGGSTPPVRISVGCDGETVLWRLYRSVDGGKTYALARELSCDEAASVDLVDDFHPESLTEVQYSLVPQDKNGNLGAPQYLDSRFIYSAKIPTPTLISVDASGTPGSPIIRARWIGPRAGVQFYRLRFLDSAKTQRRWLELPVGEIDYDPSENRFEAEVSTIDRDGNSILPNENYTVSVEAVTLAATSKASQSLPIAWASKSFNAGPSGTFRWNARPVPPTVALSDTFLSFYTDHKGVLILIKRIGGTEQGIPLMQTPPFPFMVWRQRMDKTGQPWIAVSPMLREVNYTGEFLDDGFFRMEPYPLPDSPDKLFFLDNSGHIQGATYRYLFMHFDPVSGEIKQLYGPIATTIVIPG